MAQSRSGKSSNRRKSSTGRSSSSRSRSTGTRSSASRGKKTPSRRAQRRAETPNLLPSVLLAGLGLLCVAMVLVPGQNFWKTMRGGLFGIFGIMTYLVGPFLLYLAYLLASGYRVALFAGKVVLMGSCVPVCRWYFPRCRSVKPTSGKSSRCCSCGDSPASGKAAC